MTIARRDSAHRLVLVAVLVVALALRLYLVLRGGNYYWADELRYEAARKACAAVLEGNLPAAKHALFSTSGHIGFRWMALAPAFVERAVFGSHPPHAQMCAGFFALFGVANLWLVWLIARRCAKSEWEPLLALLFAACSNALFFHARHCFPYDAALTFLLGAVYVAARFGGRWQPLVVGLCCGWAYLTYNGYWSVAAVLLIVYVLERRETWRERLRRAALAGAGLLAPAVLMFGAARAAGYDLLADSIAFADTVNQGDFGEGWQFIPQYLWIADGWLWALLVPCILAGVAACAVRREPQPWLRWVVVVLLLAVTWILFCDVVPKFVLYGRTVRATVPFLALAAAGALELLWRLGGRRGAWVLVPATAACLGGLAMMRRPLEQVFPSQFIALARPIMAQVLAREPDAVLRLLYADYIRSPDFPEDPPPHQELLRRPHPHQYPGYLFEGYTREQRPLYLGHDIALRLVQLDTSRGLHVFNRSPASRWLAPHAGPVSILVRLPKGALGTRQWLLRDGEKPGAEQGALVEYVDATHVRLGFVDRTGEPRLSDPLPCDYDAEHLIGISLGSLLPPEDDRRFAQHAAIRPLCRLGVVTFDGQTVLARAGTFVGRPLTDLAIGAAIRGGSGGPGGFSGVVHAVRQIDPIRFTDERPWRPVARMSGPFFGGHFGPVEMTLRFPPNAAGTAEPLIGSGGPGAGDLLFVSYESPTQVRLKLDHWGTPAVQSAPIQIDPAAVQRLVVSLGSLFPPEPHERYRQSPQLRQAARWLSVSLNDRLVLSRPFEFYPAEADAVLFGANIPGGTACGPAFTGEILEVRRLPPEQLFPAGGELPLR